jgi:hypothetical protein
VWSGRHTSPIWLARLHGATARRPERAAFASRSLSRGRLIRALALLMVGAEFVTSCKKEAGSARQRASVSSQTNTPRLTSALRDGDLMFHVITPDSIFNDEQLIEVESR